MTREAGVLGTVERELLHEEVGVHDVRERQASVVGNRARCEVELWMPVEGADVVTGRALRSEGLARLSAPRPWCSTWQAAQPVSCARSTARVPSPET